jgi:hypothetical protein
VIRRITPLTFFYPYSLPRIAPPETAGRCTLTRFLLRRVAQLRRCEYGDCPDDLNGDGGGRVEDGAQLLSSQIRIPFERHLYVLSGDQQAGRLLGTWPSYYVVDRWTLDQPVGGGVGPSPGLYEPQEGFSKFWRVNAAVRDCLGYATTPWRFGGCGSRVSPSYSLSLGGSNRILFIAPALPAIPLATEVGNRCGLCDWLASRDTPPRRLTLTIVNDTMRVCRWCR